MAELRGRADTVFDTSEWTVHDLRKAVYAQFAGLPGEVPSMVVNVVTFGFKRGIPPGSDLMFDVRFLAQPALRAGAARADRPRRRRCASTSRRGPSSARWSTG